MCDDVRNAHKLELLSETLAANMVTLHAIAAPSCPGMTAYACGDHHHVGHTTRAIGDACKSAHPHTTEHHPSPRGRQ